MSNTINPFPNDPDRRAIWEMLVSRDIAAFVAADWAMVANYFSEADFFGIDGRGADNPDIWRPSFPNLAAYRDEWLRQATESAAVAYAEDRVIGIHRATTLQDIEIVGDVAIAHKKFDGALQRADGSQEVMNWQTLYFCRNCGGAWKLTGFVGYLPLPMGSSRQDEAKRRSSSGSV